MELIAMERSVTKQVRLTPQEAGRLAQMAQALGRSESDILRDGLQEAEERLRRLDARRRHIQGLVRLARDVPGTSIPFRLK
jgi:hypothetical protein